MYSTFFFIGEVYLVQLTTNYLQLLLFLRNNFSDNDENVFLISSWMTSLVCYLLMLIFNTVPLWACSKRSVYDCLTSVWSDLGSTCPFFPIRLHEHARDVSEQYSFSGDFTFFPLSSHLSLSLSHKRVAHNCYISYRFRVGFQIYPHFLHMG